MKSQYMVFIFFSILFWQCRKKENICEEFKVFEAPEKLRIYFDTYALNQTVLFRSKDKFDTIKTIKIVIDTSNLRVVRECAIPTSKEIIFQSKYFLFGKPVAFKLRSTYFMTCYSTDILLQEREDMLFEVDYDVNDKSLKNQNTVLANKVQLLDSFRVQSNSFKEVLKIDVSDPFVPKMVIYFAPKKGLIRWESPTDTFNIQN